MLFKIFICGANFVDAEFLANSVFSNYEFRKQILNIRLRLEKR